ncbi:hypothetical protein ACHAWF_014453 [Thalassiosira exigua]
MSSSSPPAFRATTSPPAPKRSREPEIALLERISTSLDAYIDEVPPPSREAKRERSAADASKDAAKEFLAARTLARCISKACAREHVTLAPSEGDDGPSDPLVDALVEEYKDKHPSLTAKMIFAGIARQSARRDSSRAATEASSSRDRGDDARKFDRIAAAVAADMDRYRAKVEALRRSREAAAAEPVEPPRRRGPKRKRPVASPARGKDPERRRTLPKRYITKRSPEGAVFEEILKRYTRAREKYDRLPDGMLEMIVEDVKGDLDAEFDVPLERIQAKIKQLRYLKRAEEDLDRGAPNEQKRIVEEIYARYSRVKEASGGKLKPGALDQIIEGVKMEYGLANYRLGYLKSKVRIRFSKENPEFESGPPDRLKIGELSEEGKERRQRLLNEITARLVREKEAHPKKLPDGALDRIIEETKRDLDIHEFEVNKCSIRGRIQRKSPSVQTLGKQYPQHDAVDEALVAHVNSWLKRGISVSRAQGLELANQLLRSKGLEKDSSGREIVLDARWWRTFLDRNKKLLTCD